MPAQHIKNTILTLDATRVDITEGELTLSVEEVMIADTGTEGAEDYLEGGGLFRGEGSWTMIWKDDALPNADPPGIFPGAKVPFTWELAAGKTYAGTMFFPECNIALGSIDGGDAILYEVTARTCGAVTSPTAP